MDCKTARLLLMFHRTDRPELSDEDAEALAQHLAHCPRCGNQAEEERRADQHIGRVLRDVPVPEGLQERLLARLDRERRAWYRRWPLRHPRLTGAAAAILLLLTTAGLLWALRPKPVLDVTAILEDMIIEATQSGEQTVENLRRLGFSVDPPPQFKYRYLVSCSVEELEGRRVPRLLFANGENLVFVYIVSDREFDLEKSFRLTRANSGHFTVELRRHPTNPRLAYLIKYTGPNLNWLVEEDSHIVT